MANRLSREQRAKILHLMVEGNSMRAISRLEHVGVNTVAKLLVDAGCACADYHDRHVRRVTAPRVQCDEMWAFTYCKQKNVDAAIAAPPDAGGVWTWTALAADTKLIVGWLVGGRDALTAMDFLRDLRSRLADRMQLTTDGHRAYLSAVRAAFGTDVDYAQLLKLYGEAPDGGAGRYSPSECVATRREPRVGNPDPAAISTSYVERHNLSIRMGNRRFTRLTNACSKKLENHCHMLAIFFTHYNWCRKHKTLGTMPAVAAGLASEPRDTEWIIRLVEARTPPSTPRGPDRQPRKRRGH